MIEILAMLGGGLLRLVPSLMDFFKAKRDAEHEYRMSQLQLQIDQARAAQQIDLAHAQASIAMGVGEMTALQTALNAESSRPMTAGFLGWLSSSVRPVLTYWWCIGLYSAAKAIQIIVAIDQKAQLAAVVPLLVTEFDRSVIGAMMSFWFVDRTLTKQGK